jgi:hypothetical protein
MRYGECSEANKSFLKSLGVSLSQFEDFESFRKQLQGLQLNLSRQRQCNLISPRAYYKARKLLDSLSRGARL